MPKLKHKAIASFVEVETYACMILLLEFWFVPGKDDQEISPKRKGTCTSTTLSVEGKGGNFDPVSLKYQLWANMVIASVSRFVKRIAVFNENDILTVDQIAGYGICYTGNGHVGFYKLEMRFNERTKIITKLAISHRSTVYAAVLVDYFLDYYFKKLDQY